MDENEIPQQINYLEYGDVIKIYASSNKELHQQTFFIKYIDSASKISLINTSNLYPYTLYYDENEEGKLRDESIEEIHIVWKSPLKGYIAQNGLEPHKWIDIYFGGDFPVIFTGEITEIQDDQMEVMIYPSLEVIYIDFEYKGLPEDKDIDKIVVRSKPKYAENVGVEVETNVVDEGEEVEDNEEVKSEASIKFIDTNESIVNIPDNYTVDANIKDILHNLYIDANDIVFDTGEIEIVNQIVELDSKKKIYSLDEQITNLLDEMLSTIPNNARTKSVMDNIQRIISHFKRLRAEFSKTDEYGNIESSFILGLKDKPLVKKIQSLKANLKWIVPVVSLKKTLWVDEETEEASAEDEIDHSSNLIENLKDIKRVQDDYFKNANNEGVMAKYPRLVRSVEKYSTSFDPPTGANIIETAQVGANIESIIDNLEEFKTIVFKKSTINLQKYVIQKYGMGSSMNWIEGKKMAKKMILTQDDTIHIKSLLMMPEEFVRFSKIDLPTTNILSRCVYSQNYPMIYKVFNGRLEEKLERLAVKSGGKRDRPGDFDHEKREKDTNIAFLSNFKDFTIDENLVESVAATTTNTITTLHRKFEDFLQTIIPDTYSLISLIQRYLPKSQLNGFSMLDTVRYLEPFAIYQKNITYNTYVRIRYFIKQAITEWKAKQGEIQKEYRLIREKKWETGDAAVEPFYAAFDQKPDLQNQYYTAYRSAFTKYIHRGAGQPEGGARGANMAFFPDLGDRISSSQETGSRTSEILKSILNLDSANTVATLLRILLVSLTIPDNLLNAIDEDTTDRIKDVDDMEKVKPDANCSRRFLTKIYKSLRDLQNDNHREIYYDKSIDKTPYDLLTKDVKAKKERMSADEFLEYFAEILVQKSGVSRDISHEMANTIIRGKKLVVNGEYAVLETYPIISSRSLKEEGSTVEGGVGDMVKTYYIRTRNVWKKDDTIEDPSIFMDNNTLFCNITSGCAKRTKTDVCENTDEARRQILAKTRASLFKEFDERIDESVDSLKISLDNLLKKQIDQSKKIERMEDINIHKENKYAFDLGNIDKKAGGEDADTPHHSKWEYLLDKILSQDDFVKIQRDILTFTDRFTREPMVETLGESPYWLYCRESNFKLLPIYIYELAKAYVTGGSDEYARTLKEVVRKYGTLSENGDAIVDGIGGSGRVIQKIDFVEEELYNDAGFKIQTKTAIEKDIDEIVHEAIGSGTASTQKKKDHKVRVFENETNEAIYNILATLCRNIGISHEGIEDDVIRISSETVDLVVVSEKKYADKMKKVEKPKPYIQYKNQNIILIVAFVTFVAIQSAVPPFHPENTVPGCVLSFAGFPLEGGEDGNTDGLRYMACVLNISKSPIGVWAAIQSIKNPIQTFTDVMIKSIAKHVIQRPDVIDIFSKKREYLILNPNDSTVGAIPKAYSIQKWTGFLPPIIPYKIALSIAGAPLSETFFRDFKRSLTKGDRLQWQEIGLIKTKIIQYSFAIVEHINQIVKRNDPILNTVNSTPFLQNSCCNDLPKESHLLSALEYFASKENNIVVFTEIAAKLATSLSVNDALSLASIFVHSIDTMRQTTVIPKNGHSMENIYQSFIYYCKFDNESAPIPDFLKGIISTKPDVAEYNPEWSIAEKTKYLKENGKNYSIADLDRLMILVNSRNTIGVSNSAEETLPPPAFIQIPNVDAMLEFINHLDEVGSSEVIEDPLKRHLRAVLTSYQPNTMVFKDSAETSTLKNYLIYSNNKMMTSIYDFFDEYRGSVEAKRIESAKLFIRDFALWEDAEADERMATVVKYTKNAIREMVAIFPTMIQNNKPILKNVPEHWDLSTFHETDVMKFIESYYNPILKFMGDDSITELLTQTTDSLRILMAFIDYIPVINPLRKWGEDGGTIKQYTFYSVFDKETIYLIFRYLFNSVIYEYIQKSTDPDVIRVDIVNIRNRKRADIDARAEATEETKGVDIGSTEGVDETDRLNEIQINIGNLEGIKRKTVELLVAFLSIEEEAKNSINKSYKTVSERVVRSKLEEKKTITDYFKNMSGDERKVENTLKILKMGRWNVGLQKGVFQYDKDIYDKERNSILDIVEGVNDNALNDYVIRPDEMISDVADLELDEKRRADEEYENEEMAISHLGEDYMDGNYYGEDEAEEDRDFNDN